MAHPLINQSGFVQVNLFVQASVNKKLEMLIFFAAVNNALLSVLIRNAFFSSTDYSPSASSDPVWLTAVV